MLISLVPETTGDLDFVYSAKRLNIDWAGMSSRAAATIIKKTEDAIAAHENKVQRALQREHEAELKRLADPHFWHIEY